MSQKRPQSILTLHDAMRGFEIRGDAMNFHVVGMGAFMRLQGDMYHEVVLHQVKWVSNAIQ